MRTNSMEEVTAIASNTFVEETNAAPNRISAKVGKEHQI